MKLVLNVLLLPHGNPPSAVEKNASIITLDADQDWPLKVYFVPLNARVLVPVSAGHYHVVGQGTEIASYHMLVYAPIWTPLSLTAFRTIIVLMVTSVLLQDKRILEFLLEVTGDLRFNSDGEVFSLNSLEKETII